MTKSLRLLLLLIVFCNTAFGEIPPALKSGSDTLKILAWNIYMRPSIVPFLARHPVKRSKAIVQELKNSDYDVIIFQEAFNRMAIKKLKELEQEYQYSLGPVNAYKNTRRSSGVWILSRDSILFSDSIRFCCCKESDCFVAKGAVIAGIKKGEQIFQIIGTHLQADENKKHPSIRKVQLGNIKDNLLDKYYKEGVPQLICGDLNVDRYDTAAYNAMLKLLDAEDSPAGDETPYSCDAGENDMARGDDRCLLDYGLVRQNGLALNHQRLVKIIRRKWKRGKSDLSDHFAIELIVTW